MKNTAMKVSLVFLLLFLLLFLSAFTMKTTNDEVSDNLDKLNVPDTKKIVSGSLGMESGDWQPSSDRENSPLDHQQILKHLRTANKVAKEARRDAKSV